MDYPGVKKGWPVKCFDRAFKRPGHERRAVPDRIKVKNGHEDISTARDGQVY
jgi:hypothetical protein